MVEAFCGWGFLRSESDRLEYMLYGYVYWLLFPSLVLVETHDESIDRQFRHRRQPRVM